MSLETKSVEHVAEKFGIVVGDRRLDVHVLLPVRESEEPLLCLHFAGTAESAFFEEPYAETTRLFLEAGHRVLSFDLPSHGPRTDHYGDGITGFCNAFVDGHDPFQNFVEEAFAAIDHCLAAGLAREGRIVVCGTSRAGYMGVRLAAADSRIAATAAIAPVTDWRALSEFVAVADSPDVAALHLSQYVEQLIGRPLYLIIGNHDERVSTAECCRFFADLVAANLRNGHAESLVELQVLNTPGHFSPAAWHIEGGEFLLEVMGRKFGRM